MCKESGRTYVWKVGARFKTQLHNIGQVLPGLEPSLLNDITLGLNWFLNPNMKLQSNYSITDRHSPASPGQPIGQSDGTIQGFGVRLAMDF